MNNIKLLPIQQNIILIPVPILKKALVNDQRHIGGLTGAKVEDQVLLGAGGRPESVVGARFDTDLAALGGEHALGPFYFDCHLARDDFEELGLVRVEMEGRLFSGRGDSLKAGMGDMERHSEKEGAAFWRGDVIDLEGTFKTVFRVCKQFDSMRAEGNR